MLWLSMGPGVQFKVEGPRNEVYKMSATMAGQRRKFCFSRYSKEPLKVILS